MERFSDVIDAFGGPGEFATAVGISANHARTMKARNSIPASRWLAVTRAAERVGVSNITIEILASIEERRATQ